MSTFPPPLSPLSPAGLAARSITITLLRVGPIEAPLPRYQTSGSAGMDLHAAVADEVVLPPLGRHLFPTGLALAIPEGYEGQVRPRSGLATNLGVTVVNSPGTIDSDYRGEIRVALVNLSHVAVRIAPLQRIAQLVIAPITRAELMEVSELPATDRGDGGYGSTGRGV
jgi:dUTP pyrophosphatase